MLLNIASFCAGLAVGCVIALAAVQLISWGYEKDIRFLKDRYAA